MKEESLGPGSLSLMLIGRNLAEGEKGLGDAGNGVKEQTEANVQVPEPVWEKPVNPSGLRGKGRPGSELSSLDSEPETIGSQEGCRAGEHLQGRCLR